MLTSVRDGGWVFQTALGDLAEKLEPKLFWLKGSRKTLGGVHRFYAAPRLGLTRAEGLFGLGNGHPQQTPTGNSATPPTHPSFGPPRPSTPWT